MALIRRRVTARMIRANRRNARRSTGPRSPQAKAHVRLNAVKHGCRSAILNDYFHLWFNLQMIGPWEPPARWNPARMPVPILTRPGFDIHRRKEVREFILSVAPFARRRPGARKGIRAAGRATPAEAIPARRKEEELRNPYLTFNATK